MADITITNHGQTPAYNIRIVNSLYDSHVLWGPRDEHTTAILNPTENFTPRITSKFKNVAIVRQRKDFFLNIHLIFTDMNGRERWLKVVFSRAGADWPEYSFKIARVDGGRPIYEKGVNGGTQMFMSRMETGDLTGQKYEM